MKIGILTHWWSDDNYGQQMQLFALQKYLFKQGHEPFLIRYLPKNNSTKIKKMLMAFNPKLLSLFINRKFKSVIYNALNRNAPSREFKKFRMDYIKQSDVVYNGYNEILNNTPQADAYIVGSDQVWNFNIDTINTSAAQADLKAWYLNFAPKGALKLSYAASFGRSFFPDNCLGYMKKIATEFDYISIREENSIGIAKEISPIKPYLAADPTLLLNKEDYIQAFGIDITKKQDYSLVYLLGHKAELNIKTVIESLDSDTKIKYIASQNKIDLVEKQFPTIPQWLELIANAEQIVTNSFHGVIFCIIFKKNFVAVPLTGAKKPMNVRIESILKKLGLSEKIYSGNLKKDLAVKINYTEVQNKLKNDPDFIEAVNEFNHCLNSKVKL